MEILLIILLIVGAIIGLNYLIKNQMGYNQAIFFKHIEGIPNLGNDVVSLVYFYSDKITFNNKQTIPLSRIKGIEFISNKEIVERGKSVIGRGILGGVLFGPLGAVIGAASGIGTSKSQELSHYMIINYINKEGNNENAVLKLKNIVDLDNAIKAINDINNKIGYIPENQIKKISDFYYEI